MYLDFLNSMNGEVKEGDKKEIVGCYALINMLENDLDKEIRRYKNSWVKEKRKENKKKIEYLNGIVKGLKLLHRLALRKRQRQPSSFSLSYTVLALLGR